MSHDLITPQDVTRDMLRFSRMLDEAHDELVRTSHAWAAADALYRKTRATAYVRCVAKTVGEREAQVDLLCGEERQAAHLAEALKTAALEKVRSVRVQLNACQSIANAVRSEVETAGRWSA